MLLSWLRACLVLWVTHGLGAAQDPSLAELQRRRAEKLAKPLYQAPRWHLDLAAAQRQAAAEGKLVLAYFTRSYAG